MFCQNCGSKINDNANNCPNCGSIVGNTQQKPSLQKNQQPQQGQQYQQRQQYQQGQPYQQNQQYQQGQPYQQNQQYQQGQPYQQNQQYQQGQPYQQNQQYQQGQPYQQNQQAPFVQPVINIVNTNTNANTNNNNVIGGVVRSAFADADARNKWMAFCLCLFFGVFGAHKFYDRKVGMGLLYLFTCGLFCIGVIVDLITILGKPNPYYIS